MLNTEPNCLDNQKLLYNWVSKNDFSNYSFTSQYPLSLASTPGNNKELESIYGKDKL